MVFTPIKEGMPHLAHTYTIRFFFTLKIKFVLYVLIYHLHPIISCNIKILEIWSFTSYFNILIIARIATFCKVVQWFFTSTLYSKSIMHRSTFSHCPLLIQHGQIKLSETRYIIQGNHITVNDVRILPQKGTQGL